MEINRELQGRIISYLNGEMSAEDEVAFEKMMNENADLQAAVQDQITADNILMEDSEWIETDFSGENQRAKEYFEYYNKDENQDFYDSLKKVQAKERVIEKPLKNQRNLFFKIASIAALILLLAIAAPRLFSPGSQKLYKQYVDYESLPTSVVKGEGGEEIILKAEHAFHNHNYQLSAETFKEIESGNEGLSDLHRIYYALSLAELENYEEARNQLQLVRNNDDSLYQTESIWYAALIQLKSGDKQSSHSLVKEYLNSGVVEHKEEAENLLKKLE